MRLQKAARAIERVVNPLSSITNSVGQGILVVMMLLIVVDVVLRYVFNRPIKGSYEVIEFMLVLLVFFGLAYTQTKKANVAIDLLTRHFSLGIQAVIDSTTYLLCLAGFVVITWRSIAEAEVSRVDGVTSGLLSLPVFPFMWVVAFGSALLCLVFVVDLLDSLDGVVKNCQKPWLWLALAGVVVLLLAGFPVWFHLLPWEISRVSVGLIGVGLLILLLFSRMLIGPVMLVIGFLGFTYLVNLDASLAMMGMSPYRTTATYTMSTLSLFMVMGLFCFYAELSKDIYGTLHRWIGHLPGGLAMATAGACGGFAAVSGSGLATAVAMGTVALPEMRRYKYDDSLACGCVAAGGTLGILIPPSIPLIIYAGLTEESIGQLFMAGIFPGILTVVLMMLIIYVRVRLNPKLAPPAPATTFKEKLISLQGTWGILLLFVLVMGGIYMGVFTPTEAAGIGAFGALLIGFSRRKFNWQKLRAALADSAKYTVMLFFMLIGAHIFGYFLTVSQISVRLADFVVGLPVPNIVTLIFILLIYVILGCFMPAIATIILTLPIFFPVVTAMGYDPILYGILMIKMAEMGGITPPFGMLVFVLAGVAKDVPVSTIFRGAVPFLMADVGCVTALLLLPDIALFLPRMMIGG